MNEPARMRCAAALALLFAAQLISAAGLAQEVQPARPSGPALAGPVTEIIAGGSLLLAAPVVASILMLALGPPWFGCGSSFAGPSDYQAESDCEREADRQRGRAAAIAATVGSVQAAGGAALLIHGAYRTRRIRVNRRAQLSPSAWRLRTAPGVASVAASWTF